MKRAVSFTGSKRKTTPLETSFYLGVLIILKNLKIVDKLATLKTNMVDHLSHILAYI